MVSSSAQRLGLAQPSMSHALTRLRSLLGDELFVRTLREMKPTLRAIELGAPIAEALEQLRRALEPHEGFDPATSDRPNEAPQKMATATLVSSSCRLPSDMMARRTMRRRTLGHEVPRRRARADKRA
jgi:DNA-binding transcriptional LysR family regulator